MRAVLIAAVVAAAISTSVGFALGRVSDPPASQAAATSGDAKLLNKTLLRLHTDLTRIQSRQDAANHDLQQVCRNTAQTLSESFNC